MHFTFTVDIDVEREEGKFASRDELEEQLQSGLVDAATEIGLEGDAGGVYFVTEVNVEPVVRSTAKK